MLSVDGRAWVAAAAADMAARIAACPKAAGVTGTAVVRIARIWPTPAVPSECRLVFRVC